MQIRSRDSAAPMARDPSDFVDLGAVSLTPVDHDPFDFMIVPSFVRSDYIHAINMDFPDIDQPGNFSVEKLTCGPLFNELLKMLRGPEMVRLIEQKFDVNLDNALSNVSVRKFCEASDGNIHTDHWSKLITGLVYFNPEWTHEGGCLRMLRSATDIENYGQEVKPLAGTLLLFKRSAKSYHGHKRFIGERRMLQISWHNHGIVARSSQKLGRFGTVMVKRLARLI